MSTDQAPATSPRDVLAYLLKHAARRLTDLTDAALEPLGIDSKDLGALRVLVGREPTSQLELAHTLGIDRTSIVALLDELGRKGLVTRRADPADRRRNLVELTERGTRTYGAGEAACKGAELAFLEAVDGEDATGLRRTLRALVDERRRSVDGSSGPSGRRPV